MMWHRVAALLGGRTVDELQVVMSSEEFVRWCALYSIEPWGWHAEGWRMGMVAATVANFSGRAKKALKPSDFMPSEKRQRFLSDEETKAKLEKEIEQAGTHDD